MERPRFIDLSATSSRATSSQSVYRPGQASPRIQHYDGDRPPLLSPLDAFAAESRRLARELETTRTAGQRRMSRLPPAIITKSLSSHQANRPECFRSLSNKSDEPVPALPPLPRQNSFASGTSPELKSPSELERPQSSYPRISAVSQDQDFEEQEIFDTPRDAALSGQSAYFDLQRTTSPQPIAGHTTNNDSNTSLYSTISGLAPPNAAFARKLHQESSDDDYTSSNAGSTFSRPRKLSNSSALSFPQSPLPPHHERTPSEKSNQSITSKYKPSHLSFSRPRSTLSLDAKVDPNSAAKQSLEEVRSVTSETSREVRSFDSERSIFKPQTQTIIHHNKNLPRGHVPQRSNQRISALFSGLTGPTFGWDEPVFPGTPPLSARTDKDFLQFSPRLQPIVDNNSSLANDSQGQSFVSENGLSSPPHRSDLARPSSSRIATVGGPNAISSGQRPSTSHQQPFIPTTSDADYYASAFNRAKFLHDYTDRGPPSMKSSAMSTTTATESTVRPTVVREHSDYQALSADEHVEKAITLHQDGDLKESTYHLRIAAKQSHPTGTLLYALAVRHGWGMRANPSEGAALLKKTVGSAIEDFTKGRDPNPAFGGVSNSFDKTQFALAVYELGMSYFNGWGVEQDKPLALRCFEIAGAWGDTDALTEAGFCYAEGVGCKKDMKTAAKFYRQAAEKGVSMVGNSWIYKDKYQSKGKDDTRPSSRLGRSRKSSITQIRNPDLGEKKEPKERVKSRTRGIFGRKRSNTMSAVERPIWHS